MEFATSDMFLMHLPDVKYEHIYASCN